MPLGGVVLVTGVGQGYGRAVALGFGRAGYHVVCADRDVALASKTAAEVEEADGQAIPIQIDVAAPLDVRHAFDKVDELFGRLDGVVHVATRSSAAPASELADAEFGELLDDDLRSTHHLLRTATRRLGRAWFVIIGPPASIDAPQTAMIRGALRSWVRAYANQVPELRTNLLTPSRKASDPAHDARLVEAALFLGGPNGRGLVGSELPVALPPPPRVIETLLPEIQAALDDRVRQDDLEASLYVDDDGDEDDAGDLENEVEDDVEDGFDPFGEGEGPEGDGEVGAPDPTDRGGFRDR